MPQYDETRAWETPSPVNLEFKLYDPGDDTPAGTFTGYLSRYGNKDGNLDVLMPGTFAKSLGEYRAAGQLPPMLLNHAGIPWGGQTHSSLLPVGVWTEMQEDDRGIRAKGKVDPLDTDLGKQIYAGLRNGSHRGLSIGYTAKAFTRGKSESEPRRTITEAKLWEGSIVWMPANDLANVDQVKGILPRSIGTAVRAEFGEDFDNRNIRHVEWLLREAGGLSRSEAKTVLAAGFRSLPPRDAGPLDALLAELRSAADVAR